MVTPRATGRAARALGCVFAAAVAAGGAEMLSMDGGGRAFDLQGHRGARGLAPENTLAGFARALAVGVHTLERDVAVTRDGVVIVSHDPRPHPDLTRGPDGRWLVAPGPPFVTLDYADVLKLDVGQLRPGSASALLFPEQAPSDGERIPRLDEVYALARRAGNERVRFNVETKIHPGRPDETLGPEAFLEAVLEVARKAGALERTTVQSFDWRTLAHAQKLAPGVARAYLTVQGGRDDTVGAGRPGASPWLAGLDVDDHGGSVPRLVKAAGGRIWSPSHHDLSPAALAEAHALGLRVVPWTVNRPEDIARFVDMGVDGLITDRPDLARVVLAARGLELPAPTPVPPSPPTSGRPGGPGSR